MIQRERYVYKIKPFIGKGYYQGSHRNSPIGKVCYAPSYSRGNPKARYYGDLIYQL